MMTKDNKMKESGIGLYIVFLIIWAALLFSMSAFALDDSEGIPFLIFPLIMCWVGGYWLYKRIMKRRKKRTLLARGIKKDLRITEIKSTNLVIFSWSARTPYSGYRIMAKDWEKQYESETFYVKAISEFARVGDIIPVYYSQENSNFYWCDVDSIIREAQPEFSFKTAGDNKEYKENLNEFKELAWRDVIYDEIDSSEKPKVTFVDYVPSIMIFLILAMIICSLWTVLNFSDISKTFSKENITDIIYVHPEVIIMLFPIVILLILGIKSVLQIRNKQKMIESWIRIIAQVTDIKIKRWKNTSYIIYATNWANDFKSDPISFCTYEVGDKIPVYVDEFDNKKYWVDTSKSRFTINNLVNKFNDILGNEITKNWKFK